MPHNNQEIEAKYCVRSLERVESRLRELGAICLVPRQAEFNLRYDTPDGSLSREGRVLRLRRFDDIRLTYKGPGTRDQGVLERTEIEFAVGDYESARAFLEALGYRPIFLYEKYRAIWQTGESHVMLDEMPFGKFVEVEAPGSHQVRELARELGLNPHVSIPASYQALFERAKLWRRLTFNDITFANFMGITVLPSDFQAEFADE
jgi:adenylate cyclase class 2